MTSWRAELVERVGAAVKRAHDDLGLVDPAWVDADTNAESVTQAALDIAIPAILERAAEVAEQYAREHELGLAVWGDQADPNLAARIGATTIATAIRSLKDNPDVEA